MIDPVKLVVRCDCTDCDAKQTLYLCYDDLKPTATVAVHNAIRARGWHVDEYGKTRCTVCKHERRT